VIITTKSWRFFILKRLKLCNIIKINIKWHINVLDELKHRNTFRPKHLPADVIYLGLRCKRLRSFRRADCDTESYLVYAKVGGKFAVNKQTSKKFDVERFNLRKLNELEVRKHY